MRKKFGFDLDGVLYNWYKAVHDYLVRYRGETRNIYQYWKDVFDGKEDRQDYYWYNMTRIEHLYGQFPAKKDDVDTIKTLSKSFDIYYITHRPSDVRFTTERWLKAYDFPHRDNLIITTLDKDIVLRSIDCDYYVEDRPEILMSDLRYVTNLIAKRTLWNDLECEELPFIDEIKEILDYI